MKQATIEHKVRMGYLLHVSSDEELARAYADAHNICVTTVDLKRWKVQLHILQS